MEVKIKDIKIGHRLRQNIGNLKDLQESIDGQGLIQPIVINQNKELIAGYRRLIACMNLKKDKIEVITIPTDNELHRRLLEILENVRRKNLSGTEEKEALRDMKEIWEKLYPETKVGSTGGRGKVTKEQIGFDKMSKSKNSDTDTQEAVPTEAPAPRFTKFIADATGASERTIQRKIKGDNKTLKGLEMEDKVKPKKIELPKRGARIEITRVIRGCGKNDSGIRIRLHRTILQAVGLKLGDEVRIYTSGDKIIIEKVSKSSEDEF